MRTCYSKHEEFCLHSSRCHINVPIPLTATPTFTTDIGKSAYKTYIRTGRWVGYGITMYWYSVSWAGRQGKDSRIYHNMFFYFSTFYLLID